LGNNCRHLQREIDHQSPIIDRSILEKVTV